MAQRGCILRWSIYRWTTWELHDSRGAFNSSSCPAHRDPARAYRALRPGPADVAQEQADYRAWMLVRLLIDPTS